MGTVLLGWELGGGLGHVAKLLEVARALASRGHTPVLALKDLAGARPLLRDVPYRILQAPVWLMPGPAKFQAASYADILANRGFAEGEGLGLMVGAWEALIELTGADLVVCDHSPTLCLATHGWLPTVVIGTGFTVPPADGVEFPPLGPGYGPPTSAEQLLEVVRGVQRRRGRPAPETLPALLASPARFVHSFEEIDAYRHERRGEVVEPMHAPKAPSPPPPRGSFFAYLSGDYPGLGLILPHLAAAGFRGAGYFRGSPAGPVEAARRAGVTIYDEPPPLDRVLAEASVVIHHGGLNTTEATIAAGRPQITVPLHLEQSRTAQALGRLGIGRTLAGALPIEAFSQAMREASAGGHDERAFALAGTIAGRHYGGCLPKIVDRCLDWLS